MMCYICKNKSWPWLFYQSNIGRTELLMYRTTKAVYLILLKTLYCKNDPHLLKPLCTAHFKTPGCHKEAPPPPFLFCCDQLSQTLSSAPMQPESALLLQIESSLPASAAKQLSTALQAIIAALSHSECWLDFHYNARCHSCFSFGELGWVEKPGLVIVSSPLENTTNISFIALYWFWGDVCFPTFKGSGFMVRAKQCSCESYNAAAVRVSNRWFVWAVKGCKQGWGGCTDVLVAHLGLWEWLLGREKLNDGLNGWRIVFSWARFVEPAVSVSPWSSLSSCLPILYLALPALRVAPCFICKVPAPQSSLPNDTLMTFFIKLSLAFVIDTQRRRHALTRPLPSDSGVKIFETDLDTKTRVNKLWTTQHNLRRINTGKKSGQQSLTSVR